MGEERNYFLNLWVIMKTSNAQDHKEYIYQVSSTYDHGNFEKNRGNPKINLCCGEEGEFFFSNLSVIMKTSNAQGHKEYKYQISSTYYT